MNSPICHSCSVYTSLIWWGLLVGGPHTFVATCCWHELLFWKVVPDTYRSIEGISPGGGVWRLFQVDLEIDSVPGKDSVRIFGLNQPGLNYYYCLFFINVFADHLSCRGQHSASVQAGTVMIPAHLFNLRRKTWSCYSPTCCKSKGGCLFFFSFFFKS